MPIHITIDQKKLHRFCRENGIRRLALFGSVLRDDFKPDSDIDILVEFKPDIRIGYIGLAGLEIELGEFFGRPIHLNTARMINPRFRRDVLSEAEIMYSSAGEG